MEKIGVFNPLTQDFKINYDLNDDGYPVEIIVPSLEVTYFDKPVAEHVIKHLANEVFYTSGSSEAYKYGIERVKKEIIVVDED